VFRQILGLVFIWLFFAIPLARIATRMNVRGPVAWLAWIPFLNLPLLAGLLAFGRRDCGSTPDRPTQLGN